MPYARPFKLFEDECANLIKSSVSEAMRGAVEDALNRGLETPPYRSMGELAYPCFEVAKVAGLNPRKLAEEISFVISSSGERRFVEKAEAAGEGYVNLYVNHRELAKELFSSIIAFSSEYGLVKTERPLKVIVEHTSGNPVHPLTIGTGRNAIIGDSLVSLLKARGHMVKAHFYVNDVGLQVMIAAYGYSKVKHRIMGGKPDHMIGLVYPMTNAIVEIKGLKERLKAASNDEERANLTKEIDEWVSITYDLRSRDPELFDELLEKISKDEDPRRAI
ncbi:MAG: arginine--tRNA ligase, partial [Desulfurococcaceae archaeon]